MKVFNHHIYEYEKGLRNLVLHTMDVKYKEEAVLKLKKGKISYVIYPVGEQKINIFFGAEESVKIIKEIGKSKLSDYTPEEDFILGIMLGYDRLVQCRRYLEMVRRQELKVLKFSADGTAVYVA